MKRAIVFVILCLSLVILLHARTEAQWDGAEARRLTYDDLPNRTVGIYVNDADELFLFYAQGVRDTTSGFVYDYRLFYTSKEKGGDWSEAQEIQTPEYIIGQNRKGRVSMDTRTGIVHIAYFHGLYPKRLYYTDCTIPGWEFSVVDSLTGETLQRYGEASTGFDGLGNVHLAWIVDFDSAGFDWYRVMYANNSTGEWVKQQVSEPVWLGLGQGPASFFAVQKSGAVHIVYNDDGYCDLACFPLYVRNDSLSNTSWIADTVPKPSRPLWHYWAGPVKLDVSDRVHLLTTGCVDYDCAWPGKTRTFYYYKQAEDSLWQGEEQIPDSVLGERLLADKQLFVDEAGIPYVSYRSSSSQVYFTERKDGSWRVPYFLVGWANNPPPQDSVVARDFYFVLDSEGRGHGAFSGSYYMYGGNDDSSEIYYLPSSSSDLDTEEDPRPFHFDLFQNYPNPFNSSTIITYEVSQQGDVTLKIYNVLGKEVRVLANRSHTRGRYMTMWDARDNQGKEVASGIYFYQLRAGDYRQTRKLVLMK